MGMAQMALPLEREVEEPCVPEHRFVASQQIVFCYIVPHYSLMYMCFRVIYICLLAGFHGVTLSRCYVTNWML